MGVFDGLPDVFARSFGETVLYNGGEIVGIWIQVPILDSLSSGPEVATNRTELHVRSSDFPTEPAEGDTVVRGGVTYRVDAPPQPDGKGMIALTLGVQHVG